MDLLNDWQEGVSQYHRAGIEAKVTRLQRTLELDGYLFRNGRLLRPEDDVLNAEEEAEVLETLYTSLALAEKNVAINHLKMSEEHYHAERWIDCITNARSFLEATLREVAAAHSQSIKGQSLPNETYKRPVNVRDYLNAEGLLDADEKKALADVYGLLSGKGSHPYMAEKDQARLLRQLALVLSQFVLLRFDGVLRKGGVASTASAVKS